MQQSLKWSHKAAIIVNSAEFFMLSANKQAAFRKALMHVKRASDLTTEWYSIYRQLNTTATVDQLNIITLTAKQLAEITDNMPKIALFINTLTVAELMLLKALCRKAQLNIFYRYLKFRSDALLMPSKVTVQQLLLGAQYAR